MISRHTIVTVHIGLAVVAAWTGIVACGTSDTDPIAPKPSTIDAGVSEASTVDAAQVDGGTPVDASPTDTGAPVIDSGAGDSVCATEANHPACVKCCEGNHTSGAQVVAMATKTCACQDDVCATACAATVCATTPKKADATCQACIASSLSKRLDGGADDAGEDDGGGVERGVCLKAVKDACTDNTDCVAMDSCESACPKN